jgi:neurofibromin 1
VIMNFLQSIFLVRAEDPSGPDLRLLIDEFLKLENLQLFGLTRQSCTAEYCNYDPPNDKAAIDSQEALTRLLVRVMEVTSGSSGESHV